MKNALKSRHIHITLSSVSTQFVTSTIMKEILNAPTCARRWNVVIRPARQSNSVITYNPVPSRCFLIILNSNSTK